MYIINIIRIVHIVTLILTDPRLIFICVLYTTVVKCFLRRRRQLQCAFGVSNITYYIILFHFYTVTGTGIYPTIYSRGFILLLGYLSLAYKQNIVFIVFVSTKTSSRTGLETMYSRSSSSTLVLVLVVSLKII